MVGIARKLIRLCIAAGLAGAVSISTHGSVAAATGSEVDELAAEVNGIAQSRATLIHRDYLSGLGTIQDSIGECLSLLRQYGDRPEVSSLLLRQREKPGDVFFASPEDLAALEAAVGRPIQVDQFDLESCIRVRDQGVGALATSRDAAGFANLRRTLGKCIAALEDVGPNAAGVGILQRVSRLAGDPTYTSAATLERLENVVGNLSLSAQDLEACSDAYHVHVVLEQTLLTDNPPPCTSGETACPTGPPGSGGSCCSAGENCIRPTCRNCEAYCQTPGCFPSTATVQLEDGSTKAMPDVRLGDRVLVARADGSLGFEDVYLNTHKDEVSSAPYVELTLASGRSLSLSPRHFIPVAAGSEGAWGDHVAKGADELAAGDHVWSRAADGTMQLDRVLAAQTKVAVGAFNPLTMNGTIVVDGVVASAHSDWFLDGIVSADTQTKVYQVILAPVRLAYRAIGAERMATVTESWGVVDAVRTATTPGQGGSSLGWLAAAVALVGAGFGALLWRRRTAH